MICVNRFYRDICRFSSWIFAFLMREMMWHAALRPGDQEESSSCYEAGRYRVQAAWEGCVADFPSWKFSSLWFWSQWHSTGKCSDKQPFVTISSWPLNHGVFVDVFFLEHRCFMIFWFVHFFGQNKDVEHIRSWTSFPGLIGNWKNSTFTSRGSTLSYPPKGG